MIKNIILDLGGVIINIDYNLTAQAFKNLGADNFAKVYCQHQQNPLFDQLETGKISPAEFRKKLQELLNIKVTNEQFNNAWCAMLLDIPKARLDFIQHQLKPNYRTFLFSNANAISLNKVLEISKRDTGLVNLDDCFHKQYYSHIFGFIKPHKQGFEKILQENNLDPSETLFVDDTIRHILSAKELGLQTFHITNGLTLLDIFSHKPTAMK